MKKITSAQIALSGVLGALSIGLYLLSFYVNAMATTFNVLLSLCILMPLLLQNDKSAWLIYAVTAVVGGLVSAIFVLPYAIFFGLFPLLRYYLDKTKLPTVLKYVLKGIYFVGVVIVIIEFSGAITSPRILEYLHGFGYVAITAAGVVLLFVYDFVLTYCSPSLKKFLDRIVKQ